MALERGARTLRNDHDHASAAMVSPKLSMLTLPPYVTGAGWPPTTASGIWYCLWLPFCGSWQHFSPPWQPKRYRKSRLGLCPGTYMRRYRVCVEGGGGGAHSFTEAVATRSRQTTPTSQPV